MIGCNVPSPEQFCSLKLVNMMRTYEVLHKHCVEIEAENARLKASLAARTEAKLTAQAARTAAEDDRDRVVRVNHKRRVRGGRAAHPTSVEVDVVIRVFWEIMQSAPPRLPTAKILLRKLAEWRVDSEPRHLLCSEEIDARRLSEGSVTKYRTSLGKAWDEEQTSFDRFNKFVRHFHNRRANPRPA